MKAIRVVAHSGLEVLRLEEVVTPKPGPGDVRIRVAAAGVNFIEIYQRKGLYPTSPPYPPGSEASGLVDVVGPEVTDVRPGDRVASVDVRGSYAELAIVPAERVVVLPEGVNLRTAAAVLL